MAALMANTPTPSREGRRAMVKETFGGRLKRLREEASLTQQELADRAEMHRLGVAKLERDERQPSWATVQALAAALGLGCSAFEGTSTPAEVEKPTRPKGRPRKQPPAAPSEDQGEGPGRRGRKR